MRTKTIIAMIAVLLLAVAAPAAADSHESQVTVVHGIPGLTVDVWVDDEPFIEDFAPGTITDAQALPAGTYEIAIYEAGADPAESDPAISGTEEVPAGANVSLVAHYDAEGVPTLTAFANDVSPITDGQARLTARHTAAAPAVDIRADEASLFEGVENSDEGVVDVPAGVYAADVVLAGTSDVAIGPADLDLEAGTAYFVYAVGSADEGDLDLLVQTVDGLAAEDEGEDEELPHSVDAGSGGLAAASGTPTWVSGALLLGAALSLGAGVRIARQRP